MSLRIFLIEDEPPSVARLEQLIAQWDARASIVGMADSVAGSIRALRSMAEPDLIIADIRLGDGLSLRVFDELKLGCPVIFATAHDNHVIAALERNAIDYVLKPIRAERFAQALNKYVGLRQHFGARLDALARDVSNAPPAPARIVARKGAGFAVVPLDQVAWFTTEYKQTVLVPFDGPRLLVDEPLGDLEATLSKSFFRLNRQYLASAASIAGYRSGGRGRLLVSLHPAADDDVQVTPELAAPFRLWIAR